MSFWGNSNKNTMDSDEKKRDIHVNSFHVRTEIKSRFATTVVTSRMTNVSKTAREVSFTSRLPEQAFITDFCMQIGDKIVHGEVKEKKAAKQTYDVARSQGKSAGHVFQTTRETDIFTISTNVGAKTEVIFTLTYQEILQRVHGAYKHVVNLDLDQMQSQSYIQIEVEIVERGKITKIHVPKVGPKMGEKTNSELLKWESDPKSHIKIVQDDPVTTATVFYRVPAQELMQNQREGGQFVLLYDIDRDATGGQVQVVNGYFVHFFAPEGLEIGGKHVIFVLDKSGSMSGRKMQQTKDAMRRILGDLRKEDYFNIIWFSNQSQFWKKKSVRATMDNILQAISDVEHANTDGSTNIHDAIMDGLNLLRQSESNPLASMIVFMTDGQANVGPVVHPDQLVETISQRNRDTNFIIHTMAFGNDANQGMLQQISSKNNGLACKIYEDLDADVQLIGFYQQISSPVLADVKITYTQGAVDLNSLVYDHTSTYYNGSEMMVLGRLSDLNLADSDQERSIQAEIHGRGCCGLMHLVAKCCRPFPRPLPQSKPRLTTKAATDAGEFVERMWAYQTIKKLLKESQYGYFSGMEKEAKRDEALKLSLKYRFVTELTSMVVVEDDLKKAKSMEKHEEMQQVAHHQHAATFGSGSLFGGTRGGGGIQRCKKLSASSGRRRSPPGSYAPPPPPPPQSQGFGGFAGFGASAAPPSSALTFGCAPGTYPTMSLGYSSSIQSNLFGSPDRQRDCANDKTFSQNREVSMENRRRSNISEKSQVRCRSRSRSTSEESDSCLEMQQAMDTTTKGPSPMSYLIILINPTKPIDLATSALITEWKTVLIKFFQNLAKSQTLQLRLISINPSTGLSKENASFTDDQIDVIRALEKSITDAFENQDHSTGYGPIENLVKREEDVLGKKQIWINVEDVSVVNGKVSEVFYYLNKVVKYDYMAKDQLE